MSPLCCHVHQGGYCKIPDCYNGYIFNIQGTKGACEKNMEEAFKYSLKVKTCSYIENNIMSIS